MPGPERHLQLRREGVCGGSGERRDARPHQLDVPARGPQEGRPVPVAALQEDARRHLQRHLGPEDAGAHGRARSGSAAGPHVSALCAGPGGPRGLRGPRPQGGPRAGAFDPEGGGDSGGVHVLRPPLPVAAGEVHEGAAVLRHARGPPAEAEPPGLPAQDRHRQRGGEEREQEQRCTRHPVRGHHPHHPAGRPVRALGQVHPEPGQVHSGEGAQHPVPGPREDGEAERRGAAGHGVGREGDCRGGEGAADTGGGFPPRPGHLHPEAGAGPLVQHLRRVQLPAGRVGAAAIPRHCGLFDP
mmetsp:Transcript_7258/g.20583  ORF Transcript_7258/g.20583 Transcript_7258/m.20583 type:complete len:299 (+) Transcript_7258:388-1284(+)